MSGEETLPSSTTGASPPIANVSAQSPAPAASIAGVSPPRYLQKNANNLASALIDALSEIAFWAGLMRILELAASVTLLGLTGKLTALLSTASGTAVSLTTANGSYIDISNSTTGANIAGLVTSIITPVSHVTLGAWDSMAPKDASPNILSTLLSSTQLLQLCIWLATAIWFTIEYGSWNCSDPMKLLQQYNETSISTANTLENGLGVTFFANNYTSFDYSSIAINNSDILNIGLEDLFASLGVPQVTLSLLSADHLTDSQKIISTLSKDCSLKKGAMGISWTGFGFFVISTVLMIIHYTRDSPTVSTVAAIPLAIKEPPAINTTAPDDHQYKKVDSADSALLISTVLEEITMKDEKTIQSFSLRSSMDGYEDDFYISLKYSKPLTDSIPTITATTVPITNVAQTLVFSSVCNQAELSTTIMVTLWYGEQSKDKQKQKDTASTQGLMKRVKRDRWSMGCLVLPLFAYVLSKGASYIPVVAKKVAAILRAFFIGKKKIVTVYDYDLELLEYIQYTITAGTSPTDQGTVTILLHVEGLNTPKETVQKLRQIQRSLKGRGTEQTAFLASHALLLPKQIN